MNGAARHMELNASHPVGMLTVRDNPTASSEKGPEIASRPQWRVFWFTSGLLLAAYLLFAHGCHGTADTELFTSFTAESASPSVPR